MKILVAHNFYQQSGGEDQCFRAESALLESHGHSVVHFTRHNNQIAQMSSVSVACKTVWNHAVHREFRSLIRESRPDLVHCHNTFPLLSPSLYYAAHAEGIPVVQTLHNYRLICPNAILFRDGQVCEQCVGQVVKWPGVVHACYRASRPASGVLSSMLLVHRVLRTWSEKVGVYVALTEFSRRKLIEGGLPAEKIVVKPNFVSLEPGLGDPSVHSGNYALFVGRLSPEKGVKCLLAAWEALEADTSLKIVGDGPLADTVRMEADRDDRISWLGRVPHDEVWKLLREAMVLVFPSLCYEAMPLVVLEAFAAGTPVIASNLGASADLVHDGQTGLHFGAGDALDLAEKVIWLAKHSEERQQMSAAARREFEAQYTPERNYEMLMAIYDRALQGSGA